MKNVFDIARNAKNASRALQGASCELKNKALNAIVENLKKNETLIFEANKKDLQEAKTLVESGEISSSTYSRLKLDENKMRDMLQGIYDVISLDDPLNMVFWKK